MRNIFLFLLLFFCCAGHHKAIFEKILGKEVDMTMGETRLSGGERCNHFIRILDAVVSG